MPRDGSAPPQRRTVCVVGLRGIPAVMGGVESHCEELLPRLAEKLPHLRFVAIGRKRHVRNPLERQYRGVDLVTLPAPRWQGLETLGSSLTGVTYAGRISSSVVHIHALASGLLAPIAKLLGMKVILTIHGADYMRAKWGRLARALLRYGERTGIQYADAVICVAPSLTRSLQERYPERAERILFVPNGAPPLDEADETVDILDRLGLEAGKFVLAVGRIEPGKGFELLIDAFLRSGRPGKLVIVGGAHHERDYASSLMRHRNRRIFFAGEQPRSVLSQLYRAAALFVLPSLHEGLPICALEAGSVGCPLLLSDIPGNRDLQLPSAHYFKSEDVESLSRALQEPDERYAVSPEMFSAFDWEQIATRTAAIYRQVLGRS